MGINGRQILLAARPRGAPRASDFRIEDVELASPSDGEVLLAARFLSLDPYMRGRMDDRKSYMPALAIGDVFGGEVVAEVVESRHPEFKQGDRVTSRMGWRTHAISEGDGLTKLDDRFRPVTTALGVLGMPGLTAYAGLRNIGRPKAGETVVVAAASGPVGSLVGQIARIGGARVIGIAGGARKCSYVKEELRFDAVVDHRSGDFKAQLAAACPDGIDVYFELVGGAVWQAVLPLLNDYARIPVCGLIAQYNDASPEGGKDALSTTMREVLSRSLNLRGFIVSEFWNEMAAFRDEASAWIADGSVRYLEDVVQGFDRAPETFIGMLEGRNFGKSIIEV